VKSERIIVNGGTIAFMRDVRRPGRRNARRGRARTDSGRRGKPRDGVILRARANEARSFAHGWWRALGLMSTHVASTTDQNTYRDWLRYLTRTWDTGSHFRGGRGAHSESNQGGLHGRGSRSL
jgi:hypothetical protein